MAAVAAASSPDAQTVGGGPTADAQPDEIKEHGKLSIDPKICMPRRQRYAEVTFVRALAFQAGEGELQEVEYKDQQPQQTDDPKFNAWVTHLEVYEGKTYWRTAIGSHQKWYQGVNTSLSINEVQKYVLDKTLPDTIDYLQDFVPRYESILDDLATLRVAGSIPRVAFYWPGQSPTFTQTLAAAFHYCSPNYYFSVQTAAPDPDWACQGYIGGMYKEDIGGPTANDDPDELENITKAKEQAGRWSGRPGWSTTARTHRTCHPSSATA